METEKKIQEIFDHIHDSVVEFDEEACEKWCRKAIDEGIDAYEAIMNGLSSGMDHVGRLYEQQEYFVPELLLCSDALYAGLAVLRPHLKIK